MLQVYDFGGQPEYFPWQRLFLTPQTLHVAFAESSLSAELMFQQVEVQLQNLYCTVGDEPVLVVVSKADLAASSEELLEKVAALKSMVEAWVETMRTVKRRIDQKEDSKMARAPEEHSRAVAMSKKRSAVPNVLASGFLTVSAATGAGIAELAATIQATLLAEDAQTGARLFPRFQAAVPIAYEHVRGFLRAVIYGEDEAAAFASKPEQSGSLTRSSDGTEGEKVCFLPFEELAAKLEAALALDARAVLVGRVHAVQRRDPEHNPDNEQTKKPLRVHQPVV